ncbi:MAG: hypothetical protein AMXMBFR84_10380 [Candidatus Hydrogenedentota bacterium]
MHIPDGVLTAPVLAGGTAAAGLGVVVGLRKLDEEAFVKTAVLTSAFFVASLIHVPLGFTSVHLVLNGLTGLLLGWAVFPAIAIGLLLQAILFGFGGITALGVNTVIMALPGALCHAGLLPSIRRGSPGRAFALGFGAGFGSIAAAALLQALALMLSGRSFALVAGYAIAAHVPVMIVEGFVTGSAVSFLRRVRPETFEYRREIVPHPIEAVVKP